MAPRACILGLLAALTLSACGAQTNSAKEFSGEKALVADVIERLETAGKGGKAAEICSEILGKTLRDEIAASGANCEEEIDRAIEDADAFDLDVKSVTVTGLKATARVEGSENDKPVTRTFELVKENGAWRASSFGTS